MVENHITRELVLKRGDANESIRTLAELWWRAVYSRPGRRGAGLEPRLFGLSSARACGAARRKLHHRGEAVPAQPLVRRGAQSPELPQVSLGFRG